MGKQRQPRMARAKIVDGRLEPHVPIGTQDIEHMLGIELLIFGKFENYPIQRKPRLHRCSEGHANASARFVNGIRHEVDRQLYIFERVVEPGCKLDRFDPTLLVDTDYHP